MPIYFKKEKSKELKNYMPMENFPKIAGYDFSQDFDFGKFMGSYANMGFQGSNLGNAMVILDEMMQERKNGLKIWMSFTGNMISSGNREIIMFLVKSRMIDGIVTTAAALEEDIIKCIRPFHLASFDIKGKFLYDECVGRIGNILAPYDRYAYFERFLNGFFGEISKKGKILCTYEICREMGIYAGKNGLTKEKCDESFLYWAAKNNIPVFCPGITDGAIGDMTVFFRQKNPGFMIDVAKDHSHITKLMQECDKAGSLVLGGGIAKHYLLNAAIFREGFDYSVYVSTANEYDGSDSGGNQEEAISWAKIRPDARRTKVFADATIVFPLMIAGIVAKRIKKQKTYKSQQS